MRAVRTLHIPFGIGKPAGGLQLGSGEVPALELAAIHALDVQGVVVIKTEFKGVQAIDQQHVAVFEGFGKGVGWGSHGGLIVVND